MNEWLDEWMDGRMDGWMEALMDGWMDGHEPLATVPQKERVDVVDGRKRH